MVIHKERASNPISAYMREMGKTELLTREQEVEIFKRVEKYQRKSKRLLESSDHTPMLYIEMGRKVLDGNIRFDEVVDASSKDRYVKGLLHLIKTLKRAAVQKDKIAMKRLYNRFHFRQSLIEKWCEDVAKSGNREMLISLKSLNVAKAEMVQANLRLVISIAKKYNNRGVALLDLIQEGNLGLMKAVEKFEYKRGYKFSTYATWWVRQAVSRAVSEQSRIIRVPMHMIDMINKLFKVQRTLIQETGCEPREEEIAEAMDMSCSRVRAILKIAQHPISIHTPVGDSGNTTLGDFIEDDKESDTCELTALSTLKDKLSDVLFTLNDRERGVLEMRFGMPDRFKVTRERIRQIEAKAIRKLRDPLRAAKLQEYLPTA
mgnify:CR=1 FL=1